MFVLRLLLPLCLTFNRKSYGEGNDGATDAAVRRLFATSLLRIDNKVHQIIVPSHPTGRESESLRCQAIISKSSFPFSTTQLSFTFFGLHSTLYVFVLLTMTQSGRRRQTKRVRCAGEKSRDKSRQTYAYTRYKEENTFFGLQGKNI